MAVAIRVQPSSHTSLGRALGSFLRSRMCVCESFCTSSPVVVDTAAQGKVPLCSFISHVLDSGLLICTEAAVCAAYYISRVGSNVDDEQPLQPTFGVSDSLTSSVQSTSYIANESVSPSTSCSQQCTKQRFTQASSPCILTTRNSRLLFLAAILIASKMHDDACPSLRAFAEIGLCDAATLRDAEWILLEALSFEVCVHEEVYRAVLADIMRTCSSLNHRWVTQILDGRLLRDMLVGDRHLVEEKCQSLSVSASSAVQRKRVIPDWL